MKREIIFRGKRVDNGEWVEGNLIMVKNTLTEEYSPEIVISYSNSAFDWIEVIPESVGQFTGLFDRDKHKIFEGDIVCFKDGSEGVIEFLNGSWKINYTVMPKRAIAQKVGFATMARFSMILGSIHDNPELLNDKQ